MHALCVYTLWALLNRIFMWGSVKLNNILWGIQRGTDVLGMCSLRAHVLSIVRKPVVCVQE